MRERTGAGTAANPQTCRVLVVSGNKFTCQLVRSLLPAIGVSSLEVSHDLADAETQLKISLFDLLMIDAGPAAGFDGLSLVEMLRALPDRIQAEIPVILLVSQPTKELIDRAQRNQVKHVIAKPFSPAGLYGHVQRALDRPISSVGVCQGFLGGADAREPRMLPPKSDWKM